MAVTALGGLVVAHSIRVGGYELDDAIVHFVQAHHKLLIGQEQAEALKLEVGSAIPGGDAPAAAAVAGRDLATGLLRRTTVGAEEVRAALEQPLARIVDAVKALLERTPPELSSDVAARGMTLVGGGALLRGIDVLLQRETGLTVTVADDPLTTVARGSGRALEELETLRASSGRRRSRRRRFGP
jgi:rod shape-determining protein MreB